MNPRIRQLEAHLDNHPEDRFAMYSVALELKKAGEIELAKERFAKLLQVHPDSGAGHYQHGLLFAEIGEEQAAREAWQAGLDALTGLRSPEARRSISEIEAAMDELED